MPALRNMEWNIDHIISQKNGLVRDTPVTIVAASFSHLRSKQPVVNNKLEIEIIDNIRYIWIPTRSYNGNGMRRIFNIADYLTGIRSLPKILNNEKFDAIIASSTYPFDNFYAHSLAKNGNPFISTRFMIFGHYRL